MPPDERDSSPEGKGRPKEAEQGRRDTKGGWQRADRLGLVVPLFGIVLGLLITIANASLAGGCVVAVSIVYGAIYLADPERTRRVCANGFRACYSAVAWGANKLPRGVTWSWKRVVDPYWRPFTASTVATVLVCALGLGGNWLYHRVAPGACAPTELRVLTAPENVPALQRAGDDFARHQTDAAGDACVHVTVSGDSNYDDIESGFFDHWDGESTSGQPLGAVLGPQPDVWVPDSSAELAGIPDQTAELANRGSIGSSALVLGVPAQQTGTVHVDRNAANWSSTLKYAKSALARPDPQTSEAGRLFTAERDESKTARSPAARARFEKQVTPIGYQLSNPASLLCSGHWRHSPIPALLPEQTLVAYNEGRLGASCRHGPRQGDGPSLTAFYLSGGHTFDYPFVHVTWPDQDDASRAELVDRFHSWLTDHPLYEFGLRDAQGSFADHQFSGIGGGSRPLRPFPRHVNFTCSQSRRHSIMTVARDCYQSALPGVTAMLAVDVSGSMNDPTRNGRSRLDQARAAAISTVKILGSDNVLGLTVFPGPSQPLRELHSNQVGAITRTVEGIQQTSRERGSPVYRKLSETIGELGTVNQTNPVAIIITDGGNAPASSGSPTAVENALRSNPRVRAVVFAVGPKGCDELALQPVSSTLTSTKNKAVCYDLSGKGWQDQLDEAISYLRAGPR